MSCNRHFDVMAEVYRRLPREIPDEYSALLTQYLKLETDSRLIELGCGIGEVGIAFALAGARVVGLDSSVEMLRAAQRTPGAGRVRWVNEPVEAFDFGEREFDAVFSYESFHLFPDPFALVERVGRAIVPGGRFGVGWRIASWEDEYKDHIVSTFASFGVSLADWAYSTCHGFDEWVTSAGMFGNTLRAEVRVPSRDSIEDAATLLSSIERTSHLGDADRRRLQQALRRGFEAGAAEGSLPGTTTYGLKCAVRLPADAEEKAG
ncbi:MAG: class I SAM-dependent methyltransferase [Solirubrobacterales bacterium]